MSRRRRKRRRREKTGISYRAAIQKLGKNGLAVGYAGEERALKAFLHAGHGVSFPEWWGGIRKGTQEEDAHEIDLVAHTDRGDIFIQIKTSLFKSTDCPLTRTDLGIPIVHFNLRESDAEIRERIIQIVSLEREAKVAEAGYV